jgi:hypothetical protein
VHRHIRRRRPRGGPAHSRPERNSAQVFRVSRDVSALSRDELMARHLAELHSLATELGIEGFRLLRKGELVDTIMDRIRIQD